MELMNYLNVVIITLMGIYGVSYYLFVTNSFTPKSNNINTYVILYICCINVGYRLNPSFTTSELCCKSMLYPSAYNSTSKIKEN